MDKVQFDLDVLGTKWVVNIGELERDDAGQLRFGFMDAATHTLTVSHDADPTWRPYLLLHELLHALSFLGHLHFLKRTDEHSNLDDEGKVDQLSSILAEVLVRNDLLKIDKLGGNKTG